MNSQCTLIDKVVNYLGGNTWQSATFNPTQTNPNPKWKFLVLIYHQKQKTGAVIGLGEGVCTWKWKYSAVLELTIRKAGLFFTELPFE